MSTRANAIIEKLPAWGAISDSRDVPGYSIADAAHYLRMPAATVRSWALGRPYVSVGIRIIAMQPLGQLGERFLQHVRQDAQSENVVVSFEVHPLGRSDETNPPDGPFAGCD